MNTDAAAPVELYVYYRVADPDAARPRVQAMLAALAVTTGVQGRLMQRRDDPATLMEIYSGVHDVVAFEHALEEAVHEHGLEALVAEGTARHTERFTCA